MSKIALIGCTARKQDFSCPAIEMYTKSNYFNLKLDYCKKIDVDKIFIFIILAGNDYMKYLIEHILNTYNPVKGLGIGQQMKFFKEFECD